MNRPMPLFLSRAYQPFVLCGNNGVGGGKPQLPWLPWYRLWLVETGTLTLRQREDKGVTRLPSPCGVLQPPGDRLQVTHDHLQRWRVLEFDAVHQRRVRRVRGVGLKHLGRKLQPPPERVWGRPLPSIIPASHLPGLDALMIYCGDQWWRGDFGRARANARLAEWLAIYAEFHRDTDAHPADWLSQCRQIAGQFMYQGVTAAKWAAMVGMSRQYFARRFRAEAGQSPGQYLANLRMDEARKLLMAGGLSIKEVARLCGFRSLSSFSRFFTRAAGETPGRWRAARLHRGIQPAP